jgi:hypothetical protein
VDLEVARALELGITREPVSTSAVAMMDSEPPPSMLRAVPKQRFGRWGAWAVYAARQHLADEDTISHCSRSVPMRRHTKLIVGPGDSITGWRRA